MPEEPENSQQQQPPEPEELEQSANDAPDVSDSGPEAVSPDGPDAVAAAMQSAEAEIATEPSTEKPSDSATTESGDEVGVTNEAAASASVESAAAETPPATIPFEPPDFSAPARLGDGSQINLLDDVELDVKIELGRTEMYIEDVLTLAPGSVVVLDKTAGDPVDILVNDRLVARGEVLVLNDNFCVRINDIISPTPELERER